MAKELEWFELTNIIFGDRLREKYHVVGTAYEEGVGGTTSVTVCSAASLFDAEPTQTFGPALTREDTKKMHESTVKLVRRGKWPTY